MDDDVTGFGCCIDVCALENLQCADKWCVRVGWVDEAGLGYRRCMVADDGGIVDGAEGRREMEKEGGEEVRERAGYQAAK